MSTTPPASAPSLASTFVHLRDDLSAKTVEVTDTFWKELMGEQRPELDPGRMVMQMGFSDDWSTWEMHPAGDEIVVLMSGAVELLLERPGGVETVALRSPGDFALVPRGVWHTAHTATPSQMMFITPGKGTQNRPASS